MMHSPPTVIFLRQLYRITTLGAQATFFIPEIPEIVILIPSNICTNLLRIPPLLEQFPILQLQKVITSVVL